MTASTHALDPVCRFCGALMLGPCGRKWDVRQWRCQANPLHFFSADRDKGRGVWLGETPDDWHFDQPLPAWAGTAQEVQKLLEGQTPHDI
jgi:hypothetical protein